MQRELERLAIEEGRAALILCDRGTVDGLGYWPGEEAEFWRDVGSSKAVELARYETVIHLHTPTLDGGYNHDNPIRIESADQAALIDHKMVDAWNGHPHRYFIHTADDFLEKARQALEIIERQIPECWVVASREPTPRIGQHG